MKNINATEGPLFKNIVLFSIPIMLSSILQLLYNAADIIVVGRFAGETALAAVGSTGSVVGLVVNVLIGLSVGATVVTANCIGAKNKDGVKKTANTALSISVIGGLFMGIIAIAFVKKILLFMNSPEDVIDQSALYLRIFFAGLPVSMLYNFGAAVLRAMGDTKRPFVFLTISGIVNVVLNLIFVIVFKMGVAGVAMATVISQAVSAVLIMRFLIKGNEFYKFNIKELGIDFAILKNIVSIGVPAGVQGIMFSVSNMMIQSSINSFGSIAMAGAAASANIENFAYLSMNSVYQTAITFTSQNVGAKSYERVKRTIGLCSLFVTMVGVVICGLIILFDKELISIYTDGNKEIITYGATKLKYMCSLYFLCGIMEVMTGALRGMGKSFSAMFISILGICGMRLFWVFVVFEKYKTLECLYISYPVTWIITGLVQAICCFAAYKQLKQKSSL